MIKSVLLGGALIIASLAGFNSSIGIGVESNLSGSKSIAISGESRNKSVTTTTTTITTTTSGGEQLIRKNKEELRRVGD